MNCPNCGYYNDAGVTAAVKITDKDGHPVDPVSHYECECCGHHYEVDDATRWQTPHTSLFDQVVGVLHNRWSFNTFSVMRVPDVALDSEKELVKITVDGLDGTAFIISSIDQLDGVVFLANTWLALRAREKS